MAACKYTLISQGVCATMFKKRYYVGLPIRKASLFEVMLICLGMVSLMTFCIHFENVENVSFRILF